MKTVEIHSGFIRLDQFLKWADVVSAGGEAKIRITGGEVKVNGETVTARGKKLYSGDQVEVQGYPDILQVQGKEDARQS